MTNIRETVHALIDQDVSIRRGLAREFINVRALAQYIQTQSGLSCGLDAIMSAIRRYHLKDEIKDEIKLRYHIIAAAKVASKTKLCALHLKKEQKTYEQIADFISKKDLSGETMRILDASREITLVIEQNSEEEALKLFKHSLKANERKLGEIVITYDTKTDLLPSVFAAVSSEMALKQIGIKDCIITKQEQIFILSEHEVIKAMEVLHTIGRWAEKSEEKSKELH